MNNDLISRKALKEFINEVCFSEEWVKFRVDNGSRGQIERILKYIDNAPTVPLPDFKEGCEWIPVSERLPEKNVEVLVTTESGCVTIAEWLEYQWFIHKHLSNAPTGKLIAWCPIPKPYKEAENE